MSATRAHEVSMVQNTRREGRGCGISHSAAVLLQTDSQGLWLSSHPLTQLRWNFSQISKTCFMIQPIMFIRSSNNQVVNRPLLKSVRMWFLKLSLFGWDQLFIYENICMEEKSIWFCIMITEELCSAWAFIKCFYLWCHFFFTIAWEIWIITLSTVQMWKQKLREMQNPTAVTQWRIECSGWL